MISFTNEVGAATLVNSRDDFVRFLSKWESATDEQKYIEWNEFEDKYSDIYSTVVFSHADPSWPEKKRNSLGPFFEILPEIKEKILSVYDNADLATQKSIASIKKVIPDFTDDLMFIFLPTAFRFNGMEDYFSSRQKEVVIVGVDAVVKWKTNLDVLLSHELFHKHHFEKMKLRSALSSLVSDFWTEGLATYVSGLVHPEADLATLLYDKQLADSCQNQDYVKNLAKKYMEVFYRTFIEGERQKFRREWFWLESDSNPKRPGYCLGYHVVKSIAKSHPLSEMAQWGEMTYEGHVEHALLEIIKN